jgi:hypothetical protein
LAAGEEAVDRTDSRDHEGYIGWTRILGALNVELAEDDLKQIDEAARFDLMSSRRQSRH